MKKHLAQGLLILAVALLLCVPIGALGEAPVEIEAPKADWQLFWEEKLLPGIVFAVSAVAAVYVAILPVLSAVKRASLKFKAATKDVTQVATNGKSANTDIAAMRAEQLAFFEEMKRAQDDLSARVLASQELTEQRVSSVAKMVARGFGGNVELVKNGTAREVYQLMEGKQDE